MKKTAGVIGVIVSLITLYSMKAKEEWTPLLDSNLSQWRTYLSYSHKDGYDGKVPKDSSGKEIAPIGYDKDDQKVFSVVEGADGPVLRISGAVYGSIFTKNAFRNYHLKMKVKWGDLKFQPRENKLKDSGILYHSRGEAGVEYWRSWMLSQEFQVMEGHMGDFWCQANGMIDIRSFPSEGTMNPVADIKAPFSTFQSKSDYYCMRSANYESPANEWTTLELICFEGKSLHIVDGRVVMVLKNSRYKDKDGTEKVMDSGRIQLQSEAAEVLYKDIMIRPLTELPQQYESLFK